MKRACGARRRPLEAQRAYHGTIGPIARPPGRVERAHQHRHRSPVAEGGVLDPRALAAGAGVEVADQEERRPFERDSDTRQRFLRLPYPEAGSSPDLERARRPRPTHGRAKPAMRRELRPVKYGWRLTRALSGHRPAPAHACRIVASTNATPVTPRTR
jgi:hypothetical protein